MSLNLPPPPPPLRYKKKHNQIINELFSIISNLQIFFQARFPKSGATYSRQLVNTRHQILQGKSVVKPGSPPVEYSSRESKQDITESEGNLFNPIFKGNVQGKKHPGRCESVEPELPSYRSPNVYIKIDMMAIKILIVAANIIIRYHSVKRDTEWHSI